MSIVYGLPNRLSTCSVLPTNLSSALFLQVSSVSPPLDTILLIDNLSTNLRCVVECHVIPLVLLHSVFHEFCHRSDEDFLVIVCLKKKSTSHVQDVLSCKDICRVATEWLTYSRDPRIRGFSWFYCTSIQLPGQYLNVDHDLFVQHTFHFIIH